MVTTQSRVAPYIPHHIATPLQMILVIDRARTNQI